MIVPCNQRSSFKEAYPPRSSVSHGYGYFCLLVAFQEVREIWVIIKVIGNHRLGPLIHFWFEEFCLFFLLTLFQILQLHIRIEVAGGKPDCFLEVFCSKAGVPEALMAESFQQVTIGQSGIFSLLCAKLCKEIHIG